MVDNRRDSERGLGVAQLESECAIYLYDSLVHNFSPFHPCFLVSMHFNCSVSRETPMSIVDRRLIILFCLSWNHVRVVVGYLDAGWLMATWFKKFYLYLFSSSPPSSSAWDRPITQFAPY